MQQFTKKEIKFSLLRLLQSKPLDSIKVRSIIDDCGISRNTFYYHYHDIYDVLEDIFKDAVGEILADNPSSWEVVFQRIAGSAIMNKELISNIYTSKYIDAIINYVTDEIGKLIEEKIAAEYDDFVGNEDIRLVAIFYKHAVMGTFNEWVQNGMKANPDEIIRKIGRFLPNNIDNLLKNMESN